MVKKRKKYKRAKLGTVRFLHGRKCIMTNLGWTDELTYKFLTGKKIARAISSYNKIRAKHGI